MNDFFSKIIHCDTTHSTNSLLKEQQFIDRTLCFTFNQSSGRGRFNRRWHDFTGKNLALSLLLIPTVPIPAIHWYTAAAALALTDLITTLSIKGGWIKWPNDIFIGPEKLAGILTESVYSGTICKKIIIGIGININPTIKDVAAIDQPATSLAIQKGTPLEMTQTTEQFIQCLGKRFKRLLSPNGEDSIRREWLRLCTIVGKTAHWTDKGIEKSGIVTDITSEGHITLKTEGGVETIISGDVKFE